MATIRATVRIEIEDIGGRVVEVHESTEALHGGGNPRFYVTSALTAAANATQRAVTGLRAVHGDVAKEEGS